MRLIPLILILLPAVALGLSLDLERALMDLPLDRQDDDDSGSSSDSYSDSDSDSYSDSDSGSDEDDVAVAIRKLNRSSGSNSNSGSNSDSDSDSNSDSNSDSGSNSGSDSDEDGGVAVPIRRKRSTGSSSGPITPEECEEAKHTNATNPFEDDEVRPPPDVRPGAEPGADSRSWLDIGIGKWPNNIMPYQFGVAFPAAARIEFAAAINRIEETTCIRIVPYDASIHQGFITIVNNDPEACYVTSIGYTGNRQHIMNLGQSTTRDFCLRRGSIMHEFFHLIGTEHEMNRPDRDNTITVHWNNIQPIANLIFQFWRSCDPVADAGTTRCRSLGSIQSNLGNPSVYDSCCEDLRVVGPAGQFNYDANSIMHYHSLAGAKSDSQPTMTLNSNGDIIRSSEVLSPTDIAEANYFSQCLDDTTTTTTTPTTTTPTTTPTTTTTTPATTTTAAPGSCPIEEPSFRYKAMRDQNCDSDGNCDCRYIQSEDYAGPHSQGFSTWRFYRSTFNRNCRHFTMIFEGVRDINSSDYLFFYYAHFRRFASYSGFTADATGTGWRIYNWLIRADYRVRADRTNQGFRTKVCLNCSGR